MNYRMVAFVLGRIFAIEACLMLFPLICGMLYGEWYLLPAFLLPAALLAVLGFITSRKTPKNTTIFARDGLAIVALVWVLMSAFGALPFVISGEIPSFIDAFFETVSGFTTTGSTILTDVEALSHGTLFWRSFSHWVGGMGVLVFAMAVLPMTDGRAMHLMRAEVPGPTVGKISSKLSDSAKILYAIYFAMTLIEVILLCAGGMPLFDSLIHSFGTAGTGGFSNKGLSVGAYNNPYFEIVIGVFMLLFGINFNLYYFLLLRRFRDALCSEEMLTYLGIVGFSTVTITLNILHLYDNVGTALRTAFFQVSSIITTTGYASADFNLWPTYSRIVICILMFFGACAGSTAGGLKISRVVIFLKAAKQDLNKMLHTHAVTTVRFEGKPLDEKVLRGVHNYFNIYMLLLTLSVLLLSLDGFDIVSTFTAVVTCFNNVGPGLEMVGPMGSFADFSAPAKLLLSFDMLAGRLELYPMLALFSPRLWRKRISFLKKPKFDFNSGFQDLPPCGRSFFIGCRKMAEHRKPQAKHHLVPTCIYITKPREGIPCAATKMGKLYRKICSFFWCWGCWRQCWRRWCIFCITPSTPRPPPPTIALPPSRPPQQGRLPCPKSSALPLTTAPAPTRRKFWIYWKKSTYQQPFLSVLRMPTKRTWIKLPTSPPQATRSPCTAPATSTAKSIAVPMLSGRTSSSCARPSAPTWTPIP